MDKRELGIAINGAHASAAAVVAEYYSGVGAMGTTLTQDFLDQMGRDIHHLATRFIASRRKLFEQNGLGNTERPGATAPTNGGGGSQQSDDPNKPTPKQRGFLVRLLRENPGRRTGDMNSWMNGDEPNWAVLNSLSKQVVSAAIDQLQGKNDPAPAPQQQAAHNPLPDEAPF